jgi:hypothetical protein
VKTAVLPPVNVGALLMDLFLIRRQALKPASNQMTLDAPEDRGVVGKLTYQMRQVSTSAAREAVPQTRVRVDVPRIAGALTALGQMVDRTTPVDLVVLNPVDVDAKTRENLS